MQCKNSRARILRGACEHHAMFNQQKNDFALCKTHAIESNNRSIPLDTSHMQYKNKGFCMLLISCIEQKEEKISIKCNAKTVNKDFSKHQLHAIKEEFRRGTSHM